MDDPPSPDPARLAAAGADARSPADITQETHRRFVHLPAEIAKRTEQAHREKHRQRKAKRLLHMQTVYWKTHKRLTVPLSLPEWEHLSAQAEETSQSRTALLREAAFAWFDHREGQGKTGQAAVPAAKRRAKASPPPATPHPQGDPEFRQARQPPQPDRPSRQPQPQRLPARACRLPRDLYAHRGALRRHPRRSAANRGTAGTRSGPIKTEPFSSGAAPGPEPAAPAPSVPCLSHCPRMILRSYSRRTASFHQLFRYLTADGRAAAVPVNYNLLSPELPDPDAPPVPPGELGPLYRTIAAEFQANARHLPPRKNGVALYHEIISLSPADGARLTDREAVHILYTLADFYLERRAHGALACGIIHLDRGNPHLHLVISANRIGQAKKLRLSQNEFRDIKRELEAYQRLRYPELTHSRVNHGLATPEQGRPQQRPGAPATHPILSSPEHQRQKRLERQGKHEPSRKEHLHQLLLNAFTVCNSPEQFTALLTEHEITLYHRSGRPSGLIANDKKYRFTTLGLESQLQQALAGWQQLPGFTRACEEARAEQLRQEWRREAGYVAEIADVLHVPNPHPPPAPLEQQAQDEIGTAIRVQRQRRRDLYLYWAVA